MIAPPKPLIRAGARFLSSRTARKLSVGGAGLGAQQKTFSTLVAAMSRCEAGRADGIEAHGGASAYARFQARVPLRTYEAFIPWIERMKRGEADVLWPGRCAHYAVSSGTTAGRTKFLPITGAMLEHFKKAGLDSLLYYTARTGSSSVFRGRHLFLGGATTLTPIAEAKPFLAYGGDLSGITALNLPGWVDKHLYEPGAEIAQMDNWPAKLEAIAARTLDRDITLLAGIPSWVLILAETLRAKAHAKNPTGAKAQNLRALWPNLECLIHGGVPIAPYVDELRAALGAEVNFHEVYPASEGFIATQDADASLGLRLMTDVGIFYEFLPMSEFDESRLEELGAKTVPLEGVRAGVDYALVMTTPAGLCRYVIGDVVRFVSTDIPRLVYVGRTKLQLSAFGEHVIEKEVTDALSTVCRARGLSVGNFHVAPVFADAAAGRARGRHEWWIELKNAGDAQASTVIIALAANLAVALDAELMRLNDDYEAKRKGGGLALPEVRLVAPGTFEHWLRAKGKWGGQNKMPRCRSDREIADELRVVASV
ncbi:hypothetical protein CMV30_09255 [Nibricoccus aquaticus]|uniref:GH3 auxin-responsive promoter n=1 Tax=Nibricoccus aquaticus TaxID=2576891 RepID=A0A290QD00_9BACT|nr:GH3 auxin-responsive promoter family protein [Nibricoccus aquaticus]ATC64126.1 hypothetical protein CMV30_09255 [Nibricoccus aquaticus]